MKRIKQLVICITVASSTSFAFAAGNEGTTLRDFFTAALNNSPSLKVVEERWHASDARKSYATGVLLPQISANGEYSDNTSEFRGLSQDYTGRRYGVQLSQVLFNWQAFNNRKVASLQENQLEAEYYAQVAQLLTIIADQYLTVLLAEDTKVLINAELDAITNQVNQIQQLYNLQLAKVTDLYHGQAQQASVLSQQVISQSDLDVARENLRASSGMPVGPLKRLPALITTEALTGTQEEWLEKARMNNKLIEAGNFALQAAQKTVSQQQGNYMPKVSLVAQHQTSDIGFNNQPIDRNKNNYVGINFSVPLFASGANRALVREAESQRNATEAQLKQTNLDVLDRTRNAYFKVKTSEARIDATKKLVEATTTAYDAMKRGFELGTVTSVDVLNALRDQFRAQRELQQARYDNLRFRLVLLRESGTLTAADVEHVSDQMNAPAANP